MFWNAFNVMVSSKKYQNGKHSLYIIILSMKLCFFSLLNYIYKTKGNTFAASHESLTCSWQHVCKLTHWGAVVVPSILIVKKLLHLLQRLVIDWNNCIGERCLCHANWFFKFLFFSKYLLLNIATSHETKKKNLYI